MGNVLLKYKILFNAHGPLPVSALHSHICFINTVESPEHTKHNSRIQWYQDKIPVQTKHTLQWERQREKQRIISDSKCCGDSETQYYDRLGVRDMLFGTEWRPL